MVAELTLFLTKDQRVQVRAHKTNGGAELYCVKDFIRQTAGMRMGPDDAMLYWLSSLANLVHEREILNVYLIQFAGPYETPTVCISAQGLLILYHHLNEKHPWVNQQYREEVQDTLMKITGCWDGFVKMHDDGEIDEQLAERGDLELSRPPGGSRFNYADEFDAEQLTSEQINQRMEESKRLLDESLLRVKTSESEIETIRTRLREYEAVQENKRRKGAGFRLSSLTADLELSAADRDHVCKAVVASFRSRFPERDTFVKHGAVHFFSEDRPIVEALVREAYSGVSFGVP